MRNLSGGGVGAARFGRPRRELRPARWIVARPGPAGFAAASNRLGYLCVVRPGPAAAHGYCSRALYILQDSHRAVTSHVPEPTPNFACDSPTTLSNLEIRSLGLQRFQTLLKLHLIELHASFLGSGFVAARGVVV